MRLEQLTFTRFMAAFAIVVFHFGQHTFLQRNHYLSHLFTGANIGVSYFFVLSGFVMVIAYAQQPQPDAKQYYFNRLARIYPLYLLALGLTLWARTLLKGHIATDELLLSIAALQAWWPPYPMKLNFTGWSLSVEFFFYALFPWLLRQYKRFSLGQTALVVVVFWLVSQAVFLSAMQWYFKGYNTFSHQLLYYHPVLHLNQFLVGNLTGLVFLRYRDRLSPHFTLVSLAALCAAFYWMLKYRSLSFNYHDGLMAVVFAPLIFCLAADRSWLSRLLAARPLVFLGEMSYSLYILQLPVYVLAKIAFRFGGLTFGFFSYLALLLPLSACSYWLIEKPLRQWLVKLYKA